jgi:hypothetical protein
MPTTPLLQHKREVPVTVSAQHDTPIHVDILLRVIGTDYSVVFG